jgi:hypothetical protein
MEAVLSKRWKTLQSAEQVFRWLLESWAGLRIVAEAVSFGCLDGCSDSLFLVLPWLCFHSFEWAQR